MKSRTPRTDQNRPQGMGRAGPDFDDNYFDGSDVISYYEFLTDRYRDEWIVIDDTEEGGR